MFLRGGMYRAMLLLVWAFGWFSVLTLIRGTGSGRILVVFRNRLIILWSRVRRRRRLAIIRRLCVRLLVFVMMSVFGAGGLLMFIGGCLMLSFWCSSRGTDVKKAKVNGTEPVHEMPGDFVVMLTPSTTGPGM